MLYVTDSESTDKKGYGYNPAFQRGMRIGSAKTGEVTAFILDPDYPHGNPDTSAGEGVWADANGVIYGAEVGPQGRHPLRKEVTFQAHKEKVREPS